MRTYLFLLIAFLATSITVNAQISLGVKAGVNDDVQKLNLTGTLGLGGLDSSSKIGFNLGVFAEIGEGSFRFGAATAASLLPVSAASLASEKPIILSPSSS